MAESMLISEDETAVRALLDLAHAHDEWPKGPPPAFIQMLEQFARFGTGDDRLWDSPDKLFAMAHHAWRASANRRPGEAVIDLDVKARNESAKSLEKDLVLTITTDDKPFLVDSITSVLTEAGKSIRFFVNILTDNARGKDGERQHSGPSMRESTIYAQLDPPIDNAEIEYLNAQLHEALADVAAAVTDWEKMRQCLGDAITQLRQLRLDNYSDEDLQENIAFLNWLLNDHFSFLGVRRYNCRTTPTGLEFEHDPSGDLGVLKNPKRRILKNTFSKAGELSAAVEAFLASDEPLLIAKSNSKSLVHRYVYQDYIGIKRYDDDGKMIGEDRFIGLYTADAYNRPASDIPLLRRKVQKVLDDSPFSAGGHNEKALLNILETYPRDELFQVDVETIGETSLEILRLYKRPRVKLILRRDRFDRYISAFVFIPRDQFNSDRREAIGNLLASTFYGRVFAFYPFFGDASLVRVHFVIGLDSGAPEGPGIKHLTDEIRALCRDWDADLLESLRTLHQGALPTGIFETYRRAFDAGYREHVSAREALEDIDVLEKMADRHFDVRAYRENSDAPHRLHLKLYQRNEPVRLSAIIPTLENFGLSVIREIDYEVRPDNGEGPVWIHDFLTEESNERAIDFADIKPKIEDALTAILNGVCEDDGFNALVVAAGLTWHEAWLLRAAAKHHLQTGISYSQSYIEETLRRWPHISQGIISAFQVKFDPTVGDSKNRDSKWHEACEDVLEKLHDVSSLDQDRIIRRFINLFDATSRTNFYQRVDGAVRACIALKIESGKLEEIPEPKPYREIFVSGPMVDGVHLRFGPFARGGLRWSDRKEDFRTEVLGLVKAQRVKNAVIVPTGSKGGFFPKHLPDTDDRAQIYEAGREAYKIFIGTLLDVTDNIVDGQVVHPENVVSHDGEDPYLVVAADKGTAQFSDTANAISEARNFWLGDAFASGGSAGYDHKAMGITARGAWEAVKRHFREMGKDIQSEPFTVAGVGDMSGDVFGNGMLLSNQIQLVAAFDHRDIFIDPSPDHARSFQERKRLFEIGRSSWQDYDTSLLSKGGGIFSRSAKSISLSPEIKAVLKIKEDKVAPNVLIQYILKASVELFWLGGIGTYFKTNDEENWRVGDRANDNIRIDSHEMTMKVIGEGANLGLTQKARIEFASRGGAINTDAIDNSAGVDSSDHEVNIKILLGEAIERGLMKAVDRNALLASMTDDVAEYVLRHNYDQTRALSQLQETAIDQLESQSRVMAALEEMGRLDREVEDLPSREALSAMVDQGRGLTRPELSVLMAYAKLWLFDEIVESDVPDDPLLHKELVEYFPAALHRYGEAIDNHRLRREIIATRMANEIVDTCGVAFVHEAMLVTGASVSEVVFAYEAARQIYDLQNFASAVNALDNEVSALVQNALYFEAAELLKEQTYRLVTDIRAMSLLKKDGLSALVSDYKEPVSAIMAAYQTIAPPDAAVAVEKRLAEWKKRGAPLGLARQAALFASLERAFDVVDISRTKNCDTNKAGALFFAIGRQLKLDVLRDQMRKNPLRKNFEMRASRRLMEEVTRQQRQITETMIAQKGCLEKDVSSEAVNAAMKAWVKGHRDTFERYNKFIADVDLASQTPSVAKLSLLSRQLSELNERLL